MVDNIVNVSNNKSNFSYAFPFASNYKEEAINELINTLPKSNMQLIKKEFNKSRNSNIKNSNENYNTELNFFDVLKKNNINATIKIPVTTGMGSKKNTVSKSNYQKYIKNVNITIFNVFRFNSLKNSLNQKNLYNLYKRNRMH
jgi:hypothetical protein